MIARDPNRHYSYKVAESWESGGERRRLVSAYSFSTMPSAFAGMLTHVAIKIIGVIGSISLAECIYFTMVRTIPISNSSIDPFVKIHWF